MTYKWQAVKIIPALKTLETLPIFSAKNSVTIYNNEEKIKFLLRQKYGTISLCLTQDFDHFKKIFTQRIFLLKPTYWYMDEGIIDIRITNTKFKIM